LRQIKTSSNGEIKRHLQQVPFLCSGKEFGEASRGVSNPQFAAGEESIALKRIIPVLGKHKLQSIKPLTITRFYNQLLEKYSTDYTHHIHVVLKNTFKFAEQWELIAINPISKVTPPRVKKKEMKVWTLSQCMQFLKASEDLRHYMVFSLAIHTGMRRGEILGLRWKDLKNENKIISVKQTVVWTPGEGIIFQEPKTESSKRTITISDMLIDDLKLRKQYIEENKAEYGDSYQNNDLICCYEDGRPIKPRRVNEAFDYLTKKANLPKIRFHDLRHSHATMLLENKINSKVAAERLGHGSVKMFLDRYSHLLPNMQDEAAAAIESAMQRAMQTVDN
jgi:integrase